MCDTPPLMRRARIVRRPEWQAALLAVMLVPAPIDDLPAQSELQANASFELVVTQSQNLKPGTSRLAFRNAFVTLVHGLAPGNSDGLEVIFFTKPVTNAVLADIKNNDARELKKSDHAALVLFLDDKKIVRQVNLTLVKPGMTVTRTIAWRPEELKKYFSDVTFGGGRLALETRGTYSESDVGEKLSVTWDIDLDLLVIREAGR